MKRLRLLAALPLLACSSSAFAACPDCSECFIDFWEDLDFGTYSIIDDNGKSATGYINVACYETGRGGTLSVQAGFNDMYGDGDANGNIGYGIFRTVPDQYGWSRIIYNLYHDPGHTIPYMKDGGGDNPRIIPVPSGLRAWVYSADYYGWIYPGQNPSNGTYRRELYYFVTY